MLIVCLVTVAFVTPLVYSHCQVPCGIYDDPARFTKIAENTAVVEKATKTIEELSAQPRPNMNQLVRWVNVKDQHADDTADIITYYFMAQRIAPVDKKEAAGYEKYIKQLTLLHEMLACSMKTKQTTDLANVEKLRSLLAEFRTAYLGEKEHSH
jgi:nickel superoxide dismutase